MTIADLITAGIAAAALVLGIINYLEAREPIVHWRFERGAPSSSGVITSGRLVNDSRRFAAVVVAVEDPDAGSDPENSASVEFKGRMPAVVEPGAGIPLTAWQFIGREPTRMKITWRQRRANGWWVRPIKHSVVLYR